METKVDDPVVKKAPVDLSALDSVEAANNGVEVELYSPRDGSDLGIKIFVLGRDSDKFRDKTNAQNRARVQKMQKGGFRPGNAPVDSVEKDGIELLAACTTGWENMLVEGTVVPFSEKEAIRIYTRFPWIKEQVDAAIGDRALFMKG